MTRLPVLLTTQARCFGRIAHFNFYNGDDLMAYEMTIPFLDIPSTTWWTTPSRAWTRSGVLDDSKSMSLGP